MKKDFREYVLVNVIVYEAIHGLKGDKSDITNFCNYLNRQTNYNPPKLNKIYGESLVERLNLAKEDLKKNIYNLNK